jgi:type II secretory pathway component PulM
MVWLTPEVQHDLVYWKNPRDTGIIFGSVLVVLLAVKYVSVISVLANLSLALITATMAFRIYKSVLAAVNKSQDGHPFKVGHQHGSCFI